MSFATGWEDNAEFETEVGNGCLSAHACPDIIWKPEPGRADVVMPLVWLILQSFVDSEGGAGVGCHWVTGGGGLKEEMVEEGGAEAWFVKYIAWM